VDVASLRALLHQVRDHQIEPDHALNRLRDWPYEELDFAKVDHHRALRQSFPEVIYGAGKTPAQIAAIAARLHDKGATVLATRIDQNTFETVRELLPTARHHETARIITVEGTDRPHLNGLVGVICAGTSDLPVADEAAVTLQTMGAEVLQIADVGVAGLHRLLAKLEEIQRCDVLIVVAGMEGALPSVLGGLVSMPVIAVPTSVGYGANFGGLAALLGMLNSCANGIAVVNIDNGFGAAAFAASILQGHNT
jgi:NCAIR mutase (PurE)-related protein